MIKDKIKYLVEGELKRPSKTEVDALIKAYALMVYSKRQNAGIKTQQRFHDKCYDLIDRMEKKYPYIRFGGENFDTNISSKASEWWNSRAMKGAGVDW